MSRAGPGPQGRPRGAEGCVAVMAVFARFDPFSFGTGLQEKGVLRGPRPRGWGKPGARLLSPRLRGTGTGAEQQARASQCGEERVRLAGLAPGRGWGKRPLASNPSDQTSLSQGFPGLTRVRVVKALKNLATKLNSRLQGVCVCCVCTICLPPFRMSCPFYHLSNTKETAGKARDL